MPEVPVGLHNRIYYFPGLDGVSFPKCVSCPSPHYSEPARSHKVHGVVILSALIGLDAKPDQIRIIKKLAPELDRNAVDVMKDWSVQPPHDPDGSPVPARILFEINFKLY